MPADTLTDAHLDEPLFGCLRRDFTPLTVDQTVAEALDFLRSQPLGERIVYFYVVDRDGKLAGVVPTRRLLMAQPGASIASLMVVNVTALPTWATLRDAAEMFHTHRLLALPVIDAGGHLHGVVDVSLFAGEMSSVIERRTADDLFQLIGAHTLQGGGAWRRFVDRFPWLLCNIAGGLMAAAIAGYYQSLLSTVIVLALFMPVILAVSESVSMQTVTLTLQSLHGTRVNWRFLATSLRRELATAVLLGAGCGAVVSACAWAWKRQALIAVVVFSTVVVAMVTAALTGVALPSALRALRRDPRIASGPIVLALADFVTLVVYFNMASMLLRP